MRALIFIGILLMCVGCENAKPDSHYKKFITRGAQEQEREQQAQSDSIQTQAKLPSSYSDEYEIPMTIHGYTGEQTYSGYNFYHNGIRYIGIFLGNDAFNSAAVVDYSQFFTTDTLTVGGRTWVAITDAPVKKEK